MRLKKVQVRNYRSVRDTGEFEIESLKTILVGPNEAGKSAILQAIQQINPPKTAKSFDALRDYPRALYNEISRGAKDPKDIPVVTATFELEAEDKVLLPESLRSCQYRVTRNLDNSRTHGLIGAPDRPSYGDLRKDLSRLAAHVEKQASKEVANALPETKFSDELSTLVSAWTEATQISGDNAVKLAALLEKATPLVDEANKTEEDRLDKLGSLVEIDRIRNSAVQTLEQRTPTFVLYNNYFRVRPIIHLEHLASRLATGILDDEKYDYGNSCLLKLLGFTAKELSDLGKATVPDANNKEAFKAYRDALDKRSYELNAASVRLTDEIRAVWNPNRDRGEAEKLLLRADGQYLKVIVEDDLGVEIELDQRSEGFQWLVSFFIVFFAEAEDQNENAILLLDEPGLSLHALKQREFRETISRLAAKNQTIYTTHSPFLIGPNELDLVRVVEMTDRKVGTKVHTTVTSSDAAALLPLQEALGYDLAQSLFAQERNLVLEGLTDYWYLEALADLLREANAAKLNEKIALIPANSAGKVVYFATILHAHKLKVATLLDSDAAGENAATQDTLVHALGHKKILRTKDFLNSEVPKAEIEDIVRDTLVSVAASELSWDISKTASSSPHRPIIDIFSHEIDGFSKYKLAKAFLKWARQNDASALTESEREQAEKLINHINTALK